MTYTSHNHPGASAFEEQFGLMPLERPGVSPAEVTEARMERIEIIMGHMLASVLGPHINRPTWPLNGEVAEAQRMLDTFRTPVELRARELEESLYPERDENELDEGRAATAWEELQRLRQPG